MWTAGKRPPQGFYWNRASQFFIGEQHLLNVLQVLPVKNNQNVYAIATTIDSIFQVAG
jgi:hypothetical protein